MKLSTQPSVETRLRDRLADLRATLTHIEEGLREPLDADLGEQAIEREDEEPLEKVGAILRTEVEEVERALARVASGEYRFCELCGQVIPAARQAILPTAIRCTSCAGR